jgi:hypothetical protein
MLWRLFGAIRPGLPVNLFFCVLLNVVPEDLGALIPFLHLVIVEAIYESKK